MKCRITLDSVDDQPVLYVAIGANGTARYWQWASLDQQTGEPLPREEATRRMWQLIGLAMITAKSRFEPELVDWSRERP